MKSSMSALLLTVTLLVPLAIYDMLVLLLTT